MKTSLLVSLLGLSALSDAWRPKRDYDNADYYVLHTDTSIDPQDVASRLGLKYEGPLRGFNDHHVFHGDKSDDDVVRIELKARRRRKRDVGGHDILDGVYLAKKQEARMRHEKRTIPPSPAGLKSRSIANKPTPQALEMQANIIRELEIKDPTFDAQWHLYNTVQQGHDVNVTEVWRMGITGKNATVAIIDDGLDMYSNDLKDNYYKEGSWDFNDHDAEPKPELSDDKHGTRCAGEIGAGKNDFCGLGVAYDSRIAGIRILSGAISDADEAEAMIYDLQNNQIYSCSWGPPDDGRAMEAPDVLIKRAMLKGVQQGRGGLGSIYVFASGNGASNGDNCNFDGYTNSIYSITVGAVDRAGNHPYYSEHCSAQLVVTYSSGSGDAIHTTDVGENACYDGHGGTSAAAPLAAGIFALVMQIRPDLTWRDMQYLAMQTAAKVEDKEADWATTYAGYHFSHTFGYGKVDSYSLVQLATDWKNVKPQAWYFSPWLHVRHSIPQGQTGLAATFEVTEDMLKEANLARLEHVTVTMNVEHTRRGDLSVDLISPEKFVSHIATARKHDEHEGGYDDWTFMSVAHWGESGVGTWTIIIKDNIQNEHKGVFTDWRLNLWGESIDASKAKTLPMPNETDDDDHDVVKPPVFTTSVPSDPQATAPTVVKPSDHPVRPTKPAAGSSGTDDEQIDDGGSSSKPTSSTSTSGDGDATSTGEAQEAESSSSSWINWFPHFSGAKKVWIYGATGIIVAFCAGLGIYLFIAGRRRNRNNLRNTYEFELLDDAEAEGLNSGEKNVSAAAGAAGRSGSSGAGQKGRRTRGGELYDAFAGGSDDEDDAFAEGYHDRRPGDEGGSSRGLERPGGDEEEQYVVGDESDEDFDEKESRRH